MKQLTFFVAFITSAPCSFAQSIPSSGQHNEAMLPRAKEGDTVWVSINHINPNQR